MERLPAKEPLAEQAQRPETDLPDRSHLTGFALNTLDRMANQREDPAFIAGLRAAATTRFLVLSGDLPALKLRDDMHDALFTSEEAAAFGEADHCVFLGTDQVGAVFAHLVAAGLSDAHPRNGIAFVDLRGIAAKSLVPDEHIGALSQAKSLLGWHAHNTFCANCGSPTRASVGGSRRECSTCDRHHFPRVDPVVIMMVSDGERALLGRQTHFPAGMYTCLAGFVEPGEVMEDAVRREVFEEAGLRLGRVDYFGSQPWPFPNSLMLGCTAQALTTEIVRDPVELEDARWFPREEVRQLLDKTHPDGLVCPPRLAIANALMSAWAEA